MNIPVELSAQAYPATIDDCSPARLAACLAALGHPARIAILRHLAGAQTCCCKEVVATLDLAQSTVSQHLNVLRDAGLVRRTSCGQKSCYTVDREALRAFSGIFLELIDSCVADASECNE